LLFYAKPDPSYHLDMPSPPRSYRYLVRLALSVFAIVLAGYLLLIVLTRPLNERDWSADQERTASAVISGDSVQIQNVRNTRYRSTTDYDVRWENRTYDLQKLESVWFIVEPFANWRGPAHTFLSFGFGSSGGGDEYVAISVEIRKEKGESFSPLAGLLRQYELIYVVGDERDLIGLRANHRNDDVFLYKVRTTPEKMRALFTSMLNRANQIVQRPEFYNTLTNTCTSNIVDHIDVIAPGRIPFSYKTYLPAYSDDLTYDLGLIDTSLPRNQYRAAHQINTLARLHADSAAFSRAIRSQ
jgi:Domain of unknown function (DUF4105)